MFNNNPKIDSKLTATDKNILKVGWIIVALQLFLILVYYGDLPDKVPSHFNIRGEVDAFRDKSSIWALFVIGVLTYSGMTLVATKIKAHAMNYPMKVTEKNAPKLYALNLQMLVLLNLAIALTFLSVTYDILMVAISSSTSGLTTITIALTILTILLPLYYIYKMFKIPK